VEVGVTEAEQLALGADPPVPAVWRGLGEADDRAREMGRPPARASR